jgi:hypothetical protein
MDNDARRDWLEDIERHRREMRRLTLLIRLQRLVLRDALRREPIAQSETGSVMTGSGSESDSGDPRRNLHAGAQRPSSRHGRDAESDSAIQQNMHYRSHGHNPINDSDDRRQMTEPSPEPDSLRHPDEDIERDARPIQHALQRRTSRDRPPKLEP